MSKSVDLIEIDSDVSSRNFFDLLGKYSIEESKPYIKSLADKRNYMLLSYELFINTKEALGKRIKGTSDKKADELETVGYSSFGSSDTKAWNTIIDGFEIGYHDMFRKTAWDFFHYARLTLDMYLQVINATILDGKHNDDNVSFSKLKKDIKPYEQLSGFLENCTKNPEHEYIASFDNYLKHINVVPVSVKMNSAGIFDFTELELKEIYIESFNYKGREFGRVDAVQKLTSARDYVVESTSIFLRLLLKEQVDRMGDR